MKNILKSLGKAALYFILFIAMNFLAGMVFGTVITTQLIMESGGRIDQEAMTWQIADAIQQNLILITMISGLLTLLTLFIFFKVRKKKVLHEVGISRVKTKALVWPVLLGVSFYLFISLIMGILPISKSVMDQYSSASGLLFDGNIVISCFAALIVAPVAEEVIFRGVILSRLSRSMPAAVAAGVSSVLFAVVHGNIVWMSYTFVLGLVLCYVCIKYRSVIASIVVHFIFNLVGVISNYLNIENIPDALAVVLLSLGAAASVVLIVVIGRRLPNIKETAELTLTPEQNREIGRVNEGI
ncbi:MAG: CPBP family intramembrane metalloprotease [Clostridiales bacterium]|jgi:membrane protease YdiL (CAAX protease family)|nr:CPBP family intramembrane metalloprotease [Clostridiales bacterium]